MSTVFEKIVDNSIDAALASVEIYNKPNFRYREEVFAILIINAWELLLKGKHLKDNSDDLTSLYVTLRDGTIKKNRTGNPLTIDIKELLKKVSVDQIVVENLDKLIEIRDTVIHYFSDTALSYVVYALGAASLRNYQKLIRYWFNRSLLEYNFYIMPLAFAYNFESLSLLELEKKPETISNLIKSVASTQASISPSEDFHFVCEISTKIISAKKIAGEPDFTTSIDPNSKTITVERLQHLIDMYPLSYAEIWEKVKKEKPSVKQHEFHKVVKEHDLKNNSKYACYNFRTKTQFEKYQKTGILPKGITSIYNYNALRFILDHL
jgi:hypothetical protein